MGARRPKGLNRLAKISSDHLCLREENIRKNGKIAWKEKYKQILLFDIYIYFFLSTTPVPTNFLGLHQCMAIPIYEWLNNFLLCHNFTTNGLLFVNWFRTRSEILYSFDVKQQSITQYSFPYFIFPAINKRQIVSLNKVKK